MTIIRKYETIQICLPSHHAVTLNPWNFSSYMIIFQI